MSTDPEVWRERIFKERALELTKYKCPVCSKSGLKLRDEVYNIPQMTGVLSSSPETDEGLDKSVADNVPLEDIDFSNTPKKKWEISGSMSGNVYLADCGTCGYILPFKVGIGPN